MVSAQGLRTLFPAKFSGMKGFWGILVILSLLCAGCSDAVIWESTPQFQSTAFFGKNEAWLTTAKKGLLRTSDAGNSWQTIEVNSVGVSVVEFVDAQRGWMVDAEGKVSRSLDAGTTWNEISRVGSKASSDFHSPVQLIFIDESHGWLLETFSIWRTEDGGLNWAKCYDTGDTPRAKGQPVRGFFLTNLMGWVGATNGEIHSTVDGGRTWHSQTVASGSDLKEVFFIDERNGWLSAWPNGGIYATNDRGQTWHLQFPQKEKRNIGINSICFLNANDGWAAGQEWPEQIGRQPMRGIVLRTYDGGQNWQVVQIEYAEPFFERIYFPDNQHGWLIAPDKVYRTDYSGKGWRIVLELPRQFKG